MQYLTAVSIISLLQNDNRAVERGIIVLYNRQTSQEQNTGHTAERNGKGFNSSHAALGTYYAKWINSGRRLSGRHLDKAREICMFYAKQLLQEARQKQANRIAQRPYPLTEDQVVHHPIPTFMSPESAANAFAWQISKLDPFQRHCK